MPHHHSLETLHRFSFLKDDLIELYISLILKTFGGALIGIFIPIHLLKLGYAINDILIFYISMYLFWGLLAPLMAFISTKFGVKHIFLGRIVFIVAFIYCISYVDVLGIPLFVVGMVGSVSGSCFGVASNAIFARKSKTKHLGEDMSKLRSLPLIGAIFGPILGSLIYSQNSSYLFWIAISFYILSGVPLLLSKDTKPEVKFKLKDFFRIEKDLGIFFGIMINEGGIRGLREVMWPLFVFLSLGSLYSVGIIGTLGTIATFFFLLYIGKMADRHVKGRMIALGCIISAALWLLVPYVRDSAGFFIVAFVLGLAYSMIDVPFGSIFFNIAKKRDSLEMIVYREIILVWGRALFLIAVLLAVNKFSAAFYLAAFGSIFYLFFNFHDARAHK